MLQFALDLRLRTPDEAVAVNNSAKREDLRVKLASEEGWICLVEVEGKVRAAATSDLAQLAEAGAFYEARTGHKPEAEWYIVGASAFAINLPMVARLMPSRAATWLRQTFTVLEECGPSH